MRFILVPRLNSALAKCNNPIVHVIVKAPGSFPFQKRPCSNSTTMLHSVIIHKTYCSLLSNHIFHKHDIIGHLFKIFYQRGIDGKLFQNSNKTPVFTILSLLHQCSWEWSGWSRNGDQLLGYLYFFHH